jgi:hypothetical protein
MKRLRLIIIVLLSAIIANNSAEAKKVRLEYKLEPGKDYTYLVSMKQEIAQEVMGQSQITTTRFETKYILNVTERTDDGNFLIEEKVVSMKMGIESPFVNLDYDSESGEEPPADLAAFTRTINIPVKFLLTPQGVIKEVTDAKEYLQIMEDALANVDGPMQQMVSAMASQTASEEGLKKQISGIFFKFPDGKIKVGSPWTEETSDNLQMIRFKNNIENLLVSADKEKAVIKQSVDIQQMDMDGMEMEGMTMNYEMSGRKEGGIEVDISYGMVRTADSVTDITGVISIESPQLPTPMSIPMSIKMTESLKKL